ncbi:MAG: 2Fe-2S iron-sulfur cluster binding domain-containing protein [Spirochaetaceae bacterium]|jgi:carbon-monoxide dehydrogenase small subunit|nr:2Fe-2S iron-sulfur cluster binding domain-containing protein [Spirochaetaceae bacterium]
MTINFILNGNDVAVQVAPNTRLLYILRDIFKLSGTKASCLKGCCGACLIFYNNMLVPSCMLNAYKVRSSEIITIEGFSQTDEYNDIVNAFRETGAECCGFCDSGKILTTEALLEQSAKPSEKEIYDAFQGIQCSCTEYESLIRAVNLASDKRQRRIYGRKL